MAFSRRDLIKKSILLGTTLFMFKDLLSAEKVYSSSKEVRVLNYSYYIDPRINSWFEEATGTKVIYDEYESGEEALAKLDIGGGGYDVIILPSEYIYLAISRNSVIKLDKDLLPNLKYIDRTYFENPHDPGLEHSVPYLGGTTGLGVNISKVEEKVDSWGYVLEDYDFLGKYRKKISMLEEFIELFGTVLIYLGLDPSERKNWNVDTAEKVSEILVRQKPYIAGYYGASIYIPQLISEQLLVAHAWSGDVETVRRENPNVSYVIPEEGALRWNDFAVIPKNAVNVYEAYQWINFVTDPLISTINSIYTYYISPIEKSIFENSVAEAWSRGLIDLMPEEVLTNPIINPPQQIREKLKFYVNITDDILLLLEETRKKVLGGGYSAALIGGGIGALIAAVIGGYFALSRKRK